MGSIVGGLAGIAGDFAGANAVEQGAGQAAQSALTGFNWLQNNPYAQQYMQQGGAALGNQANVQSQIAGLLGVGGNPAQAAQAFNNYKSSVGYNFQRNQGDRAVNDTQAAAGMLDSGATAKALSQYNQNLASTTFNNYLGQLGGLNSAYGGVAGMGENMIGSIGSAGTQGGVGAANAIMQGANAQGNAWANAGGIVGNMFNGGNTGFGAFNGPGVFGLGGLLG